MQMRSRPLSGTGSRIGFGLLIDALACLFLLSGVLPLSDGGGEAKAASASSGAVKKPKPVRPTGYMIDVMDEVMMQNLNCAEIDRFRNKLPDESTLMVAMQILNEPQHSRETSNQLFGGVLTQLILTASGSPDCTMIVPLSYAPEPRACRGEGRSGISGLGMGASLLQSSSGRAGELHLLGYFDHAARLRNCGR